MNGVLWQPKDVAGIIWLYPSSSPPDEYSRLCDGTSFDTTKYTDLAKLLPNGKLPDLRRDSPSGTWYMISLGPTAS